MSVTPLHIAGLHIDPIEKKPLYHFFPGATCLTVAVVGCNLDCPYCINARHAQRDPTLPIRQVTVPEVVARLRKTGAPILCISAAEPLVQGAALAPLLAAARRMGRETLILSNLLMLAEAWRPLLSDLSALKVDLKADLPETWSTALTHARHAREVGAHVEVSTVVLPEEVIPFATYQRLFGQVERRLGPATPCHLIRFLPEHRLAHLPPAPASLLLRLYAELRSHLPFVYLDHPLAEGVQETNCAGCGATLLARFAGRLVTSRAKGCVCPTCSVSLPGRFAAASGRVASCCTELEEELA